MLTVVCVRSLAGTDSDRTNRECDPLIVCFFAFAEAREEFQEHCSVYKSSSEFKLLNVCSPSAVFSSFRLPDSLYILGRVFHNIGALSLSL